MDMKRMFLSPAFFGFIGILILLAYTYFQVKSVAVTRYTVPIKNLPSVFEGFTILQLSDLHSKEYGDNQERLLELIHKQEFDIVAITGDFVDKDNPRVAPTMDLIKGLLNKPVFYVPGNHDWWNGFTIKEPMQTMGVSVLDNDADKYFRDGEYLWIIGVDDPYLSRDDLKVASQEIAEPATKILLAHGPNIYQKAIDSKIDLVMVGHTHGGQIRLPFLGAIIAPGQGLFPELDYGLFTAGQTRMVINGGLGETFLPIRFFSRPEIVLITLTAEGVK
ncbi:MAG: metallophosphoesterase [Bacillota bacterium]